MKRNEIIEINGRNCIFDHENMQLTFPLSADECDDFQAHIHFDDDANIYFNNQALKNNSVNQLGNIAYKTDYSIRIIFQDKSFDYTLRFTNLPIVQIITPNQIHDEPKTLARMVVNDPTSHTETWYWIGIEHRGRSAIKYDKKPFGIETLGSPNLNSPVYASIFEMPSQTKWILDAMYIDASRVRNKSCFQIWEAMHDNEDKSPSIQFEFVELFINEAHRGLYAFGENMTAEKLQLSSPDALLYKAVDWDDGGPEFKSAGNIANAGYYWDGWEQKYPDPDNYLNWDALSDLRELVIHADDETFSTQIFELADMQNLVDYFLFLQLTSAGDNTGKNTFFYREQKSDPLKYLPWDLDTGFGIDWEGNFTLTIIRLSNGLYDRLLELNPNNFREMCKSRWTTLRQDTFSEEKLIEIFDNNFETITQSDILEKEECIWDIALNPQSEQAHIASWTSQRLQYLDEYFGEM